MQSITAQASRSGLASLPQSLLQHLLSLAGPTAPALALSCTALSSAWDECPKCRALWLVHNSSSIKINTQTLRTLRKLTAIATECPDVPQRDLLWLTLALQAKAGSGRYGDGSSYPRERIQPCIDVSEECLPSHERIGKAAASGDLQTASYLLHYESVRLHAQRKVALSAARKAGHQELLDLLIRNGADAVQATDADGDAFLEACRAGDLSVAQELFR